jgi:alanyl-tRNA synthetase
MTDAARTAKLYLTDPYTTSFQATLISCYENDGRIVAVLDRTHFYPDSGGQLADRGTIAGVAVSDVWEDGPDRVCHTVAAEIVPGPVSCEIEWQRRFDHMQQHTGQHLLSRAFIEVDGLETVSFHMGDDACTVDLEGGAIGDAVIDDAEGLSNSIIWQDRPVLIKTLARGELQNLSDVTLRKSLPEHVDGVRLVEIENFDVIGCCGTHVRRTGELGLVKVLKHEKAKGAHRVTFKVGMRAAADFKQKHDIAKRLAGSLTTSIDGLEDKIEKLRNEAQRNRKESQKISKRLATHDARDLVAKARSDSGRRYVVEVVTEGGEDYIKLLASELKGHDNTVSLIGTPEGAVICTASTDVDIDLATAVTKRAKAGGGSGGGKGGFASVRLPKGVATADFLEQVFEDIRKL